MKREGDRVPDVTFRTRRGSEWVERTTADIFNGRTVVVFSLPGAFTPTCSSAHVPRFEHLAGVFRENGVDEIICMSVNDPFVMNEWQESQNAWSITFLPDGNGEFTDKMGLLIGKEDLGFGKRSRRYSMLVRNGVIEKLFVEPDQPGDPFQVSDADTMLRYVAPKAKAPPDVTIFTRKGCPHCARAKARLDEAGIPYEELVLNRDYTDRSLRAVTGAHTFPQIFINAEHIGGADELEAWLRTRRAA